MITTNQKRNMPYKRQSIQCYSTEHGERKNNANQQKCCQNKYSMYHDCFARKLLNAPLRATSFVISFSFDHSLKITIWCVNVDIQYMYICCALLSFRANVSRIPSSRIHYNQMPSVHRDEANLFTIYRQLWRQQKTNAYTICSKIKQFQTYIAHIFPKRKEI